MNEAEVINLYGQIKTVRGVSKALGLDKYNVCCILAKHGIIDFLKIDDPIVNEIINMYSDNVSVSNIASNLHIAQHTIHYVLLSKKIMMRKRTPKFVKREDFFETIDTEEKAYWLGLLYADGYVINRTST